MLKIISVVGARPNFMKVAPIHKAFNQPEFQGIVNHLICHTGQHYDEKMSKVFFEDLELPVPDFYLGVGSGSHAEQTAKIMIHFEKILIQEKPDLVIVVGDVNSTIACTLTAAKLHIKTAHVEAGLRSFDRTMPEEINRLLTDSISDYLFVTEKSGMENLKREGVPEEKVFFVGNCMIDSLVSYLPKVEGEDRRQKTEGSRPVGMRLGTSQETEGGGYVLVTLHRPSNVDDREQLSKLISILNDLSKLRKVVFPVHPRTKKNLHDFGLLKDAQPNLIITHPIGYIDFIRLIKNAELVMTDSGGIQEETTYLQVQCITLRDSTERPVTVEIGTNQLLGEDLQAAYEAALRVLNGEKKIGRIPDLWDGHAAERIAGKLVEEFIS